jgi:hypothetical protein
LKQTVVPELQKKASDWVLGLKRAIKRKNANNVTKHYKHENTYLPDIAANLKEDDLIKFSSQLNASISIVLGIEAPSQGQLILKLQKKTNGEIFYHPTPTNRVFWKKS